MRTVLIGLAALLYLASGIARAEQHMFLVANDSDGYGIDRCLASGEKCGAAAANAYCNIPGDRLLPQGRGRRPDRSNCERCSRQLQRRQM